MMTKAQVEKINGKMSNGFELDLWQALVNNEKFATKKIYLNDEKTSYLKASLWFEEKYERFQVVGLCINLNVSKWDVDENGTGHSYGLGLNRKFPYGKSKKMFNDICKFTAEISDDMILEMYNGNKRAAEDAVILSGKGAHIYNV